MRRLYSTLSILILSKALYDTFGTLWPREYDNFKKLLVPPLFETSADHNNLSYVPHFF